MSIIRAGKHLYQRELITATDGNLSCQVGSRLLVTRSGVCKGDLQVEDILDYPRGTPYSRMEGASSEFRLHLALYKKRPDIKAVVHAHPIYVNTLLFSNYGERLVNSDFCPEAYVNVYPITLVPYETPGTDKLARVFRSLITPESNVYLLNRHGVIAGGETLEEAVFAIEKLEYCARIIVQSMGFKQGLLYLTPEERHALEGYRKQKRHTKV